MQRTFNIGGFVFIVIQGDDGNAVELQVPALGNGYAPYTIGFNPSVPIETATTIAAALVGLANS